MSAKKSHPKSKKPRIYNAVLTRDSLRPEKVYTVRKRPPKVIIKKSTTSKISVKQPFSLRTSVSSKMAWATVALTITIAAYIVATTAQQAIQDAHKAQSASAVIGIDDYIIKKLSLVGDRDELPKEITNYDSIPEDLQQFVLQDYISLKLRCISNGEYTGSVGYRIENVIYDAYARVVRTCGTDEVAILVKMSNRWTIVHNGNDYPMCDDVNSLRLPRGVTLECQKGTTIYSNPNP